MDWPGSLLQGHLHGTNLMHLSCQLSSCLNMRSRKERGWPGPTFLA